ncbi:MAG: DbpA RNA binding domain-containing protein [Treponema sp.]|uniref:DbpA RNA binding domain-containing protein n=1 Tax=Treponema sp. TaxID=166 RepID=UPI0025DC4D95|nr:DbpA RNA binding domain-containing protein [Treponema sp.]MBQ9622732.1 DbpA RNA binding domain-containing protein [Treponema sp.]MBR0099517.1 DbpA RNA binding domain-containing protein [Treponema sp.]MBR0494593.1 DbpA RNA binding domain-containing protein [Treponema sp.]
MAFRRNFRRNFRQNREIDLDQAANYLKDVVSKVKANPDELEALKKVFKKNVPLTMRSYVAAYLLRNAGGAIFRFNNFKDREDFHANREERFNRFERNENQTEEAAGEAPATRERFTRVQIPAENSEVVFVSIGRNRRVYPRDLVGLFIGVAGIEKERIGDIRVLANYSFVQLFKEDAEKAISALNGHIYRGRALSVSYSKQRPEGEDIEEESVDNYENNEPVPNVSNESAPIVDSYTSTNSDTMAQQAAFAKAQAEMTDEEIMAARAPRSSSTSDIM